MTTEPELTEEQLRIWIAERCGWKDIEPCSCKTQPIGTGPKGLRNHLPDYTHDLNAMYFAWLDGLSPEQKDVFERELYCHVFGEHVRWFEMKQRPIITNATALQRARAFYLATR